MYPRNVIQTKPSQISTFETQWVSLESILSFHIETAWEGPAKCKFKFVHRASAKFLRFAILWERADTSERDLSSSSEQLCPGFLFCHPRLPPRGHVTGASGAKAADWTGWSHLSLQARIPLSIRATWLIIPLLLGLHFFSAIPNLSLWYNYTQGWGKKVEMLLYLVACCSIYWQ